MFIFYQLSLLFVQLQDKKNEDTITASLRRGPETDQHSEHGAVSALSLYLFITYLYAHSSV